MEGQVIAVHVGREKAVLNGSDIWGIERHGTPAHSY